MRQPLHLGSKDSFIVKKWEISPKCNHDSPILPYFIYSYIYLYIRNSTCMAIALYIFPPLFPLSSFLPSLPFILLLSSRQSFPSWECDRSHSLVCRIAFTRAQGICRKTVYLQSKVYEKWAPAQRFNCPTVTHPSTDPAQEWSPGTGYLSYTEPYRLLYIYIFSHLFTMCLMTINKCSSWSYSIFNNTWVIFHWLTRLQW